MEAATSDGTGVDGIFGGNTRAAVVALQQNYGIDVDGAVGRQTFMALRVNEAVNGVAASNVRTRQRPGPATVAQVSSTAAENTATNSSDIQGLNTLISRALDLHLEGESTLRHDKSDTSDPMNLIISLEPATGDHNLADNYMSNASNESWNSWYLWKADDNDAVEIIIPDRLAAEIREKFNQDEFYVENSTVQTNQDNTTSTEPLSQNATLTLEPAGGDVDIQWLISDVGGDKTLSSYGSKYRDREARAHLSHHRQYPTEGDLDTEDWYARIGAGGFKFFIWENEAWAEQSSNVGLSQKVKPVADHRNGGGGEDGIWAETFYGYMDESVDQKPGKTILTESRFQKLAGI
jgi:hypothetical protein